MFISLMYIQIVQSITLITAIIATVHLHILKDSAKAKAKAQFLELNFSPKAKAKAQAQAKAQFLKLTFSPQVKTKAKAQAQAKAQLLSLSLFIY